MKTIGKLLKYLSWGGVIRTLYINFKAFPLRKAIKLPILVGRKVAIRHVRRGCIVCPPQFGIIRLGIDRGSFQMHEGIESGIDFNKHGVLVCKGLAIFSSTFHLNISGRLTIGKNFSSNSGFLLSCGKSIKIGDNALLGWNVTIIDGDGHHISIDGNVINVDKEITIGTHCWLSANVTILKGVTLKDNTVVPFGCVVTKSSTTPNCIYGIGNRVVKENISWKI